MKELISTAKITRDISRFLTVFIFGLILYQIRYLGSNIGEKWGFLAVLVCGVIIEISYKLIKKQNDFK
jgi:hypothetical protein